MNLYHLQMHINAKVLKKDSDQLIPTYISVMIR